MAKVGRNEEWINEELNNLSAELSDDSMRVLSTNDRSVASIAATEFNKLVLLARIADALEEMNEKNSYNCHHKPDDLDTSFGKFDISSRDSYYRFISDDAK